MWLRDHAPHQTRTTRRMHYRVRGVRSFMGERRRAPCRLHIHAGSVTIDRQPARGMMRPMTAPKNPRGRPRFDPARKVEYRTVSVRLESGVVEAFEAWCKNKNTNRQRVLREYVEMLLTSK